MAQLIMDRRAFTKLAVLGGLGMASASLLSACSGEARNSEEPESQFAADDVAQSNTQVEEPAPAEESVANEGGPSGILVAAFSWSGNTWQVADRISSHLGCNLFRIEPAEAYTTDYNAVLDVAQAEQDADARPALRDSVVDWGAYSTIFLGYPVWWYDAPQVIRSFCDEYDFAGKTVIPFCTSGGSSLSITLDSVQAGCAGATFLDGITLDGDTVASHLDEVDAWVDGLGLQ